MPARGRAVSAIGAGGGSILGVDAHGVLKVGPESAGADPGPVAYGRGGTRPTITDCYLVTGLIDPAQLPRRPPASSISRRHAPLWLSSPTRLELTGTDDGQAARAAWGALEVATARHGDGDAQDRGRAAASIRGSSR